MIDPSGVEWLTIDEAAARLGIPRGTVSSWSHRKVRAHKIDGKRMVCWPDCLRAEHDTRGRYVAQRRRASAH